MTSIETQTRAVVSKPVRGYVSSKSPSTPTPKVRYAPQHMHRYVDVATSMAHTETERKVGYTRYVVIPTSENTVVCGKEWGLEDQDGREFD